MNSIKNFRMLTLVLVLVVSSVSSAIVSRAEDLVKPVIFIHGMAGSAQQFESQAMRFVSNGWPADYLFAFEWTAAFPSPETTAERMVRLDAYIDTILMVTGADKVYLMGHSAGTGVSQSYLALPERAAKVAKYVNIDGSQASALPGGVPTLAIWAELAGSGAINPSRQIVGATNVVLPGQYHVQSATSAEAFAAMFEFFTGNAPVTTDIVPEPPGQVRLAGRAVFFPANQGVGEATLQIWEVDGATGFRTKNKPEATYGISGNGYYDGTWGPFKAQGAKQYEFVLLREGFRPHHFYFQPFTRSNNFIRLNTSPPGGIGEYMDQSDNHSNIVITRQNELRNEDILKINNDNVVAALDPITKAIIGLFVYDKNADGESDLTQPCSYYNTITFMSGVDLYMPAFGPPVGTISIVLTPRGGGGKTQKINIANWASSGNAISIGFNDYIQDINAWTEYVPRQAPGQRKKK